MRKKVGKLEFLGKSGTGTLEFRLLDDIKRKIYFINNPEIVKELLKKLKVGMIIGCSFIREYIDDVGYEILFELNPNEIFKI